MCTAYAKAHTVLPNNNYKTIAEQNIRFILDKFVKEDGKGLYHTYKDGQRQYDAFLDDYAFLIETLLEVHSITQNRQYLEKAMFYTEYVIENFWDESSKLFFFTSKAQTDIIIRRKELYDSAIPSGISTMVHNLQKIGILMDKAIYRNLAREILEQVSQAISNYPVSFSRWAKAMMSEVYPMPEIAVVGEKAMLV